MDAKHEGQNGARKPIEVVEPMNLGKTMLGDNVTMSRVEFADLMKRYREAVTAANEPAAPEIEIQYVDKLREPTDDELAGRVRNHPLFKAVRDELAAEQQKPAKEVTRQPSAMELETMVREHPLFKRVNEELTTLRNRLAAVVKDTLLFAFTRRGMITFAVNDKGEPIQQPPAELSAYALFSNVQMTYPVYVQIPRKAGDRVEIQLPLQGVGVVRYTLEVKRAERDDQLILDITATSDEHDPLGRPRRVFLKDFLNALATPSGFFNNPKDRGPSAMDAFRIELVKSPNGGDADAIDVANEVMKALSGQRRAGSSRLEAGPVHSAPAQIEGGSATE